MSDTIYQKAIAELWEYWQGHGEDCSADSHLRDAYGDCILSEAHFAREYKNLNPSEKDIGIAQEWLEIEAENLLNNYDPDCPEEGDEYVDDLIEKLQAEVTV